MNKKINSTYLITYILTAIFMFILMIIFFMGGMLSHNNWMFVPAILCALLMVLWLALVPVVVPVIFRNVAYNRLESRGFKIERIYKNFTYSLLIDITDGLVAIIYSFNPATPYVFSAKRIQNVWIDEKTRQYDNYIGLVGVRFIVDGRLEMFDTYNQSVGKTGAKVYLSPNHPNIISARQNAQNIISDLRKCSLYQGKNEENETYM